MLSTRRLFKPNKYTKIKKEGKIKTLDIGCSRFFIRAIEIAKYAGKTIYKKRGEQKYDVLKIGIKIDDTVLKKKIKKRLLVRLKQGMVTETKKLHKKGLSWRRMEELGLEYRYLSRYIRGKISKQQMVGELNTAIWQYARRQKTWFKRDKDIMWIKLREYKKIENEIKQFLT